MRLIIVRIFAVRQGRAILGAVEAVAEQQEPAANLDELPERLDQTGFHVACCWRDDQATFPMQPAAQLLLGDEADRCLARVKESCGRRSEQGLNPNVCRSRGPLAPVRPSAPPSAPAWTSSLLELVSLDGQ